MIDDVKVGTDSEIFLQHKLSGEIVSAEGIIKGTKEEPFQFRPEKSPFFATSLDNVMAEFNIPPVDSAIDFYLNTQYAINYIKSILPAELCTCIMPAAKISEQYLQTDNAKLFGCEKDYNVWMDVENPPPVPVENLRSCGGHVHVSYKEPNPYISALIIKALDIYLGVPSVIQEPDNQRKLLYGKAGAHRMKSYGCEYRTISNYYLTSKDLTMWVYDQVMQAVRFINEGGFFNFPSDTEQRIQDCINFNKKDTAYSLMKQFNIKLAA